MNGRNAISRRPCRPAALLAALVFVVIGARAAAVDQALAQSWEDMRVGRWNDAQATLERARASFPHEAAKVGYAEGALWMFRRPQADLTLARRKFQEVVERHPGSPEAPWALLALARPADLGVLKSNPEEAATGYRQVIERFPESDAAWEAVIHLPLALWEAEGTEGAREGARILTRWLEEHPPSAYTAVAELELGRLQRYPLQNDAAAVAHLRRAVEAGLRSEPLKSSTIWTIAALAEQRLDDPQTAAEYYRRFLKEFPRHTLSFRARQALERLGEPVPALPEEFPDL